MIADEKLEPYLVPHDLRLHSLLYVILNAWADDVFAFAQLRLLKEPHFGVVAEVCVILRHREGHGHLHAIRGVPAKDKTLRNWSV